jgi:hypothetical protein
LGLRRSQASGVWAVWGGSLCGDTMTIHRQRGQGIQGYPWTGAFPEVPVVHEKHMSRVVAQL